MPLHCDLSDRPFIIFPPLYLNPPCAFSVVFFFFFLLFADMITQILRQGKPLTHTLSMTRSPRSFHHLSDCKFYSPPLLHHVPRIRTYHAVPPSTSLILQNQVRSIQVGSIPKLALRAFRLPAFVAGTTITGATIANNKLQGIHYGGKMCVCMILICC